MGEYPLTESSLYDILFTIDIYYSYSELQPDIAQICQSLYIYDQNNVISRSINITNNCIEYVKNKLKQTYVLTGGDLFKIDRAIKSVSIVPLMPDDYSNDVKCQIESVWSILHNLYGPARQYPLLLETAIAIYCFLILSKECRVSMQTITILLATLYQNRCAFCGLHSQWALSTDPRLGFASMNIEDAITHILYVLKQMWVQTAVLTRGLKRKQEEITQVIIHTESLRQISAGFNELLAENICIRNQDVSEKLCISNKTAIKNLKQLEQAKILYSIRKGREIYYFNRILLDLLSETTEVPDSG